jgi:hypothetical protein
MKTALVKLAVATSTAWLLTGSLAFAATDGTAGTTSTGTSSMFIDIPALVKITGVADLWPDNGGNEFTGVGDLENSDPVCIYSNMDTGSGSADYTVTASGSGAASALTVNCSTGVCNGDSIQYRVYWDDGGGEAIVGSKGTGGVLSGNTGWSNQDDCGSSTNATFKVNFQEQDLLDNVRHGRYTGTLTLLITPSP